MFSTSNLSMVPPIPLPPVNLGVAETTADEGEKLFIEARKETATKAYAKAFGFYFMAAMKGHVPSMFYMGKCWENGQRKGAPLESNAEAIQWYQCAVSRGHKEAHARYMLLAIQIWTGQKSTAQIDLIQELGINFRKLLVNLTPEQEAHFADQTPQFKSVFLESQRKEKANRHHLRTQNLFA